jgi:hypothetical protein
MLYAHVITDENNPEIQRNGKTIQKDALHGSMREESLNLGPSAFENICFFDYVNIQYLSQFFQL